MHERGRRIFVPVLPLRDMILLPHMVIPIFVGRDKSLGAIQSAVEKDRRILFVLQRDPKTADPGPGDLYGVGTLGAVIQSMRLSDGTLKVLVEGDPPMASS